MKAYDNLIKLVADNYEEEIKDNDFEPLREMVRCYKMTSEDIKEDVESIICDSKIAWMDGVTGEITTFDGKDGEEPYKYKTFIAAVRKELWQRGF